MSTHTGVRAWLGSHTAGLEGQVMYGTFPGSAVLRAGSDWGTEAALLERADCGSVLGWRKLDAPQPTVWKLVCGMRYPPAAAGICVALLENRPLLMGHPLIFSCRGASGRQNCGFLLWWNL